MTQVLKPFPFLHEGALPAPDPGYPDPNHGALSPAAIIYRYLEYTGKEFSYYSSANIVFSLLCQYIAFNYQRDTSRVCKIKAPFNIQKKTSLAQRFIRFAFGSPAMIRLTDHMMILHPDDESILQKEKQEEKDYSVTFSFEGHGLILSRENILITMLARIVVLPLTEQNSELHLIIPERDNTYERITKLYTDPEYVKMETVRYNQLFSALALWTKTNSISF